MLIYKGISIVNSVSPLDFDGFELIFILNGVSWFFDCDKSYLRAHRAIHISLIFDIASYFRRYKMKLRTVKL